MVTQEYSCGWLMPDKGLALLSHFSSGPKVGKEKKEMASNTSSGPHLIHGGGVTVSLTWTSRLKLTVGGITDQNVSG